MSAAGEPVNLNGGALVFDVDQATPERVGAILSRSAS